MLTCTGPNRHALLVEGAKKEGEVVWVTTLRQQQLVEPLVAAFNKLYPDIKVKFTVTNTNAEIQTLEQAWKGHKYDTDLVDSTLGPITLAAAGYIQPFSSPELANYPAVQKSAPSGPVQWVSEVNYYLATAYNTKLVPPDQAPKTYEDLLKPQFKGKKMVIPTNSGSGGPMFVGNILLTMGDKAGHDYLEKLSKQELALTASGGPAEVQSVATGQFAVGLMNFDDHVTIARDKGEPLNVAFLQPVPATFALIGIMSHAPHANAAALLLDFVISKEGQTIIRDGGGLPAYPGLAPKDPELAPDSGGWKANFIAPAVGFAHTQAWANDFKKYFGS